MITLDRTPLIIRITPDKYRVAYHHETGWNHILPTVSMSAARAGMLSGNTPMLCPVHDVEALRRTVTSHDGRSGVDAARYRFPCGCRGTAKIRSKS